MNRLWAWLLDLLFPPKCVFCRALLDDGEHDLCRHCRQTLPWLSGPAARQQLEFLTLAVSPLRYEETVRASFHRYKFYGQRSYAGAYGRLMAQCVQEHFPSQCELVTWAPLSPRRKRERGYDQAQLLAQIVAQELDLPLCSTLEKTRHTAPQSGLSEEKARRANAQGAYRCTDPPKVQDRRVLLVDDIITTGSTASECAHMLRAAGAKEVFCVTLARAHGERCENLVKNTVEMEQEYLYNEKKSILGDKP